MICTKFCDLSKTFKINIYIQFHDVPLENKTNLPDGIGTSNSIVMTIYVFLFDMLVNC